MHPLPSDVLPFMNLDFSHISLCAVSVLLTLEYEMLCSLLHLSRVVAVAYCLILITLYLFLCLFPIGLDATIIYFQ